MTKTITNLSWYSVLADRITNSFQEEGEVERLVKEAIKDLVYRVCCHMSKSNLARRVGIDPSFLRMLAKGDRTCTPSRYLDIYKVYAEVRRNRSIYKYDSDKNIDHVEVASKVRRFLDRRRKLEEEVEEKTPKLVTEAIDALTLPGLARQLPRKWSRKRVEMASRGLEKMSLDEFLDVAVMLETR